MMDEILGAYLAGEATESERRIVKDWLNENPENKKLFYEFRLIWNESKEVKPEVSVNVESAWEKFRKSVDNTEKKPLVVPFSQPKYWLKIAAIFLLLLGGGFITFYLSRPAEEASVVSIEPAAEQEVALPVRNISMNTQEKTETEPETVVVTKEPIKQENITAAPKNVVETVAKRNPIADDCKTKKYVCNSTPCPIEICIIQKGRCNGGRQLPIFNCSIIQPDESGKLCYGGVDEKFYQDCAIAIQEIRIKRVSTGETIVLNQQSSPMTAQEVFSYISGQKKGDIIAGVFQNDCNDEPGQQSLTIENQYGSLMFR